MTPTDSLACALDGLAESLKHPKHVAALDPIRADAKAVLARFFKRQKRLVVGNLGYELRVLAKHNPNVAEAHRDGTHLEYLMSADHVRRLREAADEDAKAAVLTTAVPDNYALPNAVTKGLSVDYESAMTAALAAGYDTLATDLAVAERSISADVTAEYLRERSLEALATQLSGTTVARIQTALADAYEAGADYDGLVSAVTDTFDEMAETRAGLIAQTAMNAAYNAGRKQLGLDLGFNEKSWACDGPNPCAVCLENEADGWIGIDETFSSGDDIPVAHPGCYCSLDVRASAGALAA
jgi:hypothetical protein